MKTSELANSAHFQKHMAIRKLGDSLIYEVFRVIQADTQNAKSLYLRLVRRTGVN